MGITRLDHVVGQRRAGQPRASGSATTSEVLGFDQLTHFSDDQISTEYSALMSTVVWNHDKVVLPINEPAEGRQKSQIEEYLDFYGSPGVQHIALHTDDIVAVGAGPAATAGVRFMDVPAEYYDEARARLDGIDLPWDDARGARDPGRPRPRRAPAADLHRDAHRPAHGVLRDHPARGRPGFGEGNFKALFEAIERAQARRGNL